MDLLKRIWKEEEGQGLVEYGLILLIVVVSAVVVLNVFDTQLANIFGQITTKISGFLNQ